MSTDPDTGLTLLTYADNYAAIYGMVVDNSLATVTPRFLISETPGLVGHSQPFAEWNPDANTWLVAWDNDQSVVGRVVTPAGPTGSTTLLANTTSGGVTFNDYEQVEVSYGGADKGYLVGFKAAVHAHCQEIFGVLVDANGAPLSPEASVLSSAVAGPETPGGACDVSANDGLGIDYAPDAGTWLVAWKDQQVGQQASARTVVASGNVPIATSATLQVGAIAAGAPSVVYDAGAGRFLMAWTNGGALSVAPVSTSGLSLGATAVVGDGSVPSPRRPHAAYDPATQTVQLVAHSGNTNTTGRWVLPSGSTASVAPKILSAFGQRPVVDAGFGCVMFAWMGTTGVEFANDCLPIMTTPSQELAPGGDVAVTGENFGAGETVDVYLHPDAAMLATTTADANGSVSVTVTIPSDTAEGAHRIELRGALSGSVWVDITIAAAAVDAEVPTVVTAAPTLPPTGPADSSLMLASALLLTLAGAAIVLWRRRQVA